MQTLRMLFKELGFGVIVEVIIILGSRFTNNLPAITSFFSIVVPISIVALPAYFVYLVFFKYKRLIKVIRAGVTGYYYSFPLSENEVVWRDVKKEFRYLGISSNSFLEPFREWVKTNNPDIRYYFLLMSPDAKALTIQIAYERGINLEEDITTFAPDILNQLKAEVEATKERITSAVNTLKTLPKFKNGRLEIRFYDEFVPWWMYIFDGRKIYLGILPKGERGLNSPVIIMNKNDRFLSPFDAFKNTFDRMWKDAVKVK